MSVRDDCTLECEAAPKCTTCSRTKAPFGRDPGTEHDLCTDHVCDGYHMLPKAGHLWPGEIARARATETES